MENVELDVCGLICPIPVLKTKKAIEELPEGETLTIVGDYKPALDNIKRFVKTHGHRAISTEESEDGFKIVVKK